MERNALLTSVIHQPISEIFSITREPVFGSPSKAGYIVQYALAVQLVMFGLYLSARRPSPEHE